MSIGNNPVWPFDPNWSSSVNETLEWLTDILVSPTGSEQRRTRRYYPRQTLDFTITLDGAEQRFLDNMLFTYGASDWYLPLWFDVTVSSDASTLTFIPCAPSSRLKVGAAVFIKGATPFDYRVAEISAVGSGGITITPALTSALPIGSQIIPMTTARLIEQPSLTAITDSLVSGEPQFLVTAQPTAFEPTASDAGLTHSYRNDWVLLAQPDRADTVERGQQRMLSTMESSTGIPEQIDTAQRPFPFQKQSYFLDGATEHIWFYSLLQYLKGRLTNLWVPTWMDDLRLATATTVSGNAITVARCGFTLAGGPRPERQDIMIETNGGQVYFRRITDSVIAGQTETLLIDTAIGVVLQPSDILRVCFMSLMRLDHDAIEIEHVTDTLGLSKSQLMFRAAPDTRVVASGF